MSIKDKVNQILKAGLRDKDKEDHSLRKKSLDRAKHFTTLNAGTPHDWEDMEKMQEQADKAKEESD